MRVIISPLIAVSVQNQAELIKKLLASKGFDVEYKTTISIYDIKDEKNVAFLWFTLATVRHVNDAVAPYLYCHKPKAIYVTIEGVPTKANLTCSNIPKLEFIANSNFTAKCLKQVGLHVKDVVHHAVDMDLAKRAKEMGEGYRLRMKKEYGNRCKILYVGRHDPRKGLEKLDHAINIVNEKWKDKVVFLMVTETGAIFLQKHYNVINISNFGSLRYHEVLQLMSACDYLIFPSYCEGFGLPVLEANSVGTPAIHAWFSPLSEFSSTDFNFVWEYRDEKLVKQGNAQFWIFHDYGTDQLADMIGYAIDVYFNSRKEYDEYRAKAMDHASNWDYRKIYPKLLRHLGIE